MTVLTLPAYLQGVDNIYCTNDFIVTQVLIIRQDAVQNTTVHSYDTYYRRTPERDVHFRLANMTKANARGKRLPSNSFTRTYVD